MREIIEGGNAHPPIAWTDDRVASSSARITGFMDCGTNTVRQRHVLAAFRPSRLQLHPHRKQGFFLQV